MAKLLSSYVNKISFKSCYDYASCLVEEGFVYININVLSAIACISREHCTRVIRTFKKQGLFVEKNHRVYLNLRRFRSEDPTAMRLVR